VLWGLSPNRRTGLGGKPGRRNPSSAVREDPPCVRRRPEPGPKPGRKTFSSGGFRCSEGIGLRLRRRSGRGLRNRFGIRRRSIRREASRCSLARGNAKRQSFRMRRIRYRNITVRHASSKGEPAFPGCNKTAFPVRISCCLEFSKSRNRWQMCIMVWSDMMVSDVDRPGKDQRSNRDFRVVNISRAGVSNSTATRHEQGASG
jgi:hypothetical protein